MNLSHRPLVQDPVARPLRARSPWSPHPLEDLSPEDRHLFRRFGQGPTQAVPQALVHRAFERRAAQTPHAVAVEHLGEAITYRELDRQANRLAALLALRGVRPGDNVGLFVRRGIPMVAGLLAALKAGAAYVPQDIGIAPEAQLRHVIDTASIRVILTLSGFQQKIPVVSKGQARIAIDTVMARPLAGDHDAFEPAGSLDPDSGCYVLFTSGTTGRPNGVTVTHRNVCNLLLTSPGDLGMLPGLRVSQILNIGFDMAAWEILGSLVHGATLVIRGKDIAETVERVDVVIATPTILGSVDPARCRWVLVAAVAGEPCPRSLADRWAAFCVFYNACGPTETTIVNTMQRHDPSALRLTIGRPTPNNTVYVLDQRGRPCAIGEVGELWAGGDCVSAGYLRNPELTAERYTPDPFLGGGRLMFRTRDLGRWTPDGELEHLGRTDDQVKVRGFRVELDAVSAILEAVPGCTRAVTLKVDERTLVSFVTPARLDPESARQAVADALPYYCVPAAILPMEALPMTGRGKVDKGELLRMAAAGGGVMTTVHSAEQTGGSPRPAAPEAGLPPLTSPLRRVFKHPRLMHHNRLVALVLAANLALLGHGLGAGGWWSRGGADLRALSYTVLGNFALAIVIRQQYVINLLFRIATAAPTTWPLRIRWTLAKVYHFGGLHVGSTVSGTLWFLALLGTLTYDAARGRGGVTAPTVVVSWALAALLSVMVATALPPLRARSHDRFERIHRFGGWAALALFWAQTVLSARDMGEDPATSPRVWILSLLTFSIALPWLRLRRVPVRIERPSSHAALVHFDHGATPFAGSSTAISRRPLLEWHSFANVPAPGRPGFRLTISRAGDWTASFIDDLPSHVWVKGITTAGVANIETLFTRVIYVATGSGIGPCLPHLLAEEVPARLVWSARDHRATYGDALVDEILAVQPDAILWNTAERGKPDMIRLAYEAYAGFGAEAVICISNKKLTWQVVHGLERRGIPAYGAIWDS